MWCWTNLNHKTRGKKFYREFDFSVDFAVPVAEPFKFYQATAFKEGKARPPYSKLSRFCLENTEQVRVVVDRGTHLRIYFKAEIAEEMAKVLKNLPEGTVRQVTQLEIDPLLTGSVYLQKPRSATHRIYLRHANVTLEEANSLVRFFKAYQASDTIRPSGSLSRWLEFVEQTHPSVKLRRFSLESHYFFDTNDPIVQSHLVIVVAKPIIARVLDIKQAKP